LICPSAGHNMHMDNPKAFANIIINDLLGGTPEELKSRPVLKAFLYDEVKR